MAVAISAAVLPIARGCLHFFWSHCHCQLLPVLAHAQIVQLYLVKVAIAIGARPAGTTHDHYLLYPGSAIVHVVPAAVESRTAVQLELLQIVTLTVLRA